jgi:cysteine desulfurase
MEADTARRRTVAARLAAGLRGVAGVRLNGPAPEERLPGHVQVSVDSVEGETLAVALAARGVAVSPGSACTAHAGKAAPALEAIGLEAPWTHSAVLLTAGPEVTDAEVDAAIAAFHDAVASLRAMSPLGR